MVRFIRDDTGRFPERPHYDPRELDLECERIITDFLRDLYGKVQFPISTDDLTKLIERDAADLDLYAELEEGVEGVTEFFEGKRPHVKISARLTNDSRLENRLRTTLTHEFGHVHFHMYLWKTKKEMVGLFESNQTGDPVTCKREDIIGAKKTDWMEWQAGYVCGSLLMPLSALKSLITKIKDDNNIFDSVTPNSPHGVKLISATVNKFKVSEDAARVRLLQLKYLSQFDSGPSLFG